MGVLVLIAVASVVGQMLRNKTTNGSYLIAPPPQAAASVGSPGPSAPATTEGDWQWARALVPADVGADPASRDYFARAIAIGRNGGGIADEFFNATGEVQYGTAEAGPPGNDQGRGDAGLYT